MLIGRYGWKRFANIQSNITELEHKTVSNYGGIEKLAKSNYGRNMWSIMTKFNMPPSDPRLQAMTSEQLNFVLYSMHQDVEIANAYARGNTLDADQQDTTFDFEAEDFDVVPDRFSEDDMEHIAKQLSDNTQIEGYDEMLQEKISVAKESIPMDKAREATLAKEQMKESLKTAQELSKARQQQAQMNKNTNYISDDYTKL